MIDGVPARHHMVSEIPPSLVAKPDLKKVERENRKRVGGCIRRARKFVDWSLQELQYAIEQATGSKPDIAQLSRWEAGTERPHFDALFAVKRIQGPLVIALASLAAGVQVDTTVHLDSTLVD